MYIWPVYTESTCIQPVWTQSLYIRPVYIWPVYTSLSTPVCLYPAYLYPPCFPLTGRCVLGIPDHHSWEGRDVPKG